MKNWFQKTKFSMFDGPTSGDQATCSRKVRYPTKAVAKEAAARIGRNGAKMYAYACPACEGWHLTRTPPEVERDRRRR